MQQMENAHISIYLLTPYTMMQGVMQRALKEKY